MVSMLTVLPQVQELCASVELDMKEIHSPDVT